MAIRGKNPKTRFDGVSDVSAYFRFLTPAWSTEPPTKDGWYWAYDRDDGFLDMVYYGDSGGMMWIQKAIAKLFTHHWLGPLPKPEPPPSRTRGGVRERRMDNDRVDN